MYNLTTDGVSAFFARHPEAKKLVRREPLSGLVDGSNKIFLTTHPTLLASSLKVYLNGVQLDESDIESTDADGGEIVLAAAPTTQPLASYTAVPVSSTQVVLYAWAGFELMQAMWDRGLRLSSDPAIFDPADYDSPAIYVVSVNGSTCYDPVAGNLTLSTSNVQKQLLSRCMELAYLDAQLSISALSDVDFAERLGGARVNAMGRARNIKLARDNAWEEMDRALFAAMQEADPDGSNTVEFIAPRHTKEYETVWQWQSGSQLGTLVNRGINWGNP